MGRHHYLGHRTAYGASRRYLILPWVRVPHLASHVLGLALHPAVLDWEDRHGAATKRIFLCPLRTDARQALASAP